MTRYNIHDSFTDLGLVVHLQTIASVATIIQIIMRETWDNTICITPTVDGYEWLVLVAFCWSISANKHRGR
jgi:hypothetical protein